MLSATLLAVLGLAAGSSAVSYLGRHFGLSEWRRLKGELECMAGNASWVKFPSRDAVKLYDRPCAHYYNDAPFCNRTEGRAALSYAWRTHEAAPCKSRLRHWTSADLCALVRSINLNLLLVGDSIQQELFMTLYSALRNPGPGERCDCHGLHQDVLEICGGGHVMVGARNVHALNMGATPSDYEAAVALGKARDYVNLTDAGGEREFRESHEPWQALIGKHNISLLVLNRGPHWMNETVVLRDLRETLTAVFRAHGPNISVIYRTAVPGHTGCGRFFDSPPQLPRLEPEAGSDPAAAPTVHQTPYHWQQISEQNKAIASMLASDFPQVVLLDVHPSTVLRADSHREPPWDCLHYCIPGPIDNWVELLFSQLAVLSEYRID